MADPGTLSFYDREASAYASKRLERARPPRLAEFAARLAPAARVLDLGCGGGQHSALLIERGFEVTSVDLSPGLAAEAKRRWNIDVRPLAFDQLDYDAAFDAVWAWASLHHAQTSELPAIFGLIHRALAPNGSLSASFKIGPDRRDKLGRFYCAMDEPTLTHLVADDSQWRNVGITLQDGGGHDDEPVQWLILDAYKV
jgi:SAM-dependent methyltransferase